MIVVLSRYILEVVYVTVETNGYILWGDLVEGLHNSYSKGSVLFPTS